MIYIENPHIDPKFNLALEEHLFHSPGDETVLILWRNNNSVIIGRYQNTIEQIDALGVRDLGVNVVRRITGGGAVYHDLGNLNYTVITPVKNLEQVDFKIFALPVVRALQQLGANAELSGRNDMLLDGRKISGTAQCCVKNRILFHGTLLFDSNLDMVEKVLRVSDQKIKSKGIQSIKSRVMNIRPYLNTNCDIVEFKNLIIESVSKEHSLEHQHITESDYEASQVLVAKKYGTSEWNYGESPPANYKNSGTFACGSVSVHLQIEEGSIYSCSLFGDFLGLGDIRPLEKALCGIPYEPQAVEMTLNTFDLNFLFGGLSSSELLPVFFGSTD